MMFGTTKVHNTVVTSNVPSAIKLHGAPVFKNAVYTPSYKATIPGPSPNSMVFSSLSVKAHSTAYNGSHSGKSKAGVLSGQCSTSMGPKLPAITSGSGAISSSAVTTGDGQFESITYTS